MNDLVCIKIKDRQRGVVFALTWGRLFDGVDSQELLRAVKRGVSAFGLNEVANLELCRSLACGAGEPYFYEGLFSFAQRPIPFGPKYKSWASKMRSEVASGKSIFLISESATATRPNRQSRRKKPA